jgi:hypothetical protein
MLQTLTFSGPRLINAAASFFRYESGSAGGADESIRVRADGQDLGLYFPGDAIELPQAMGAWEITPSTPACAGTVRLGVGRVQSARLVGTVRVIDGERDKVAAGVCFRGSQGLTGGPNGPLIQIYNPPGSGRNLFMQAIRIGSSGADAYGITRNTNALPTAASGITNMRKAGTASVAQIYTDKTGAAVLNPEQVASGFVAASSEVIIQFPRQLMLAPGEGAIAYIQAPANTIRANFEWEEWPV